eukprot:3632027-Rhodomonas_salina.3
MHPRTGGGHPARPPARPPTSQRPRSPCTEPMPVAAARCLSFLPLPQHPVLSVAQSYAIGIPLGTPCRRAGGAGLPPWQRILPSCTPPHIARVEPCLATALDADCFCHFSQSILLRTTPAALDTGGAKSWRRKWASSAKWSWAGCSDAFTVHACWITGTPFPVHTNT